MSKPFFAKLLNRFASLLTESDSLQFLRTGQESLKEDLASVRSGQEHLREELAALLASYRSLINELKPPVGDIPADRIRWPESVGGDPTRTVIGSEGAIYSLERADLVYGEAFRRCFEFFLGTGITGDILEFGTYRGYSARLIAGLMTKFNWQGKLYLFDSFEGFPEFSTPIESESYEVAVTKSWYPGQAKPESEVDAAIRLVLEQILPTESFDLVKGFYSETLPTWRSDSLAALVNIDCDLYESTLLVLNHLIEKEILQDGTVLLFDDFNSNRANPRLGERRALAESFHSQDRYGYSPFFTYGWHGAAFFVHDLSVEFG